MWITNLTHKIEGWASGSDFIYKIAAGYYHDVIDREIILAKITQSDHILCIGGGLCPFSAILLHQKTGALVTVIDNNSTCIPKAKKIIERLGIGEHVNVLCRDGGSKELCLSKYSIVHFALQVFPMDHVFSQVEKYAQPGTKMLVRLPKKGIDKMYSRLLGPAKDCSPYTIHKTARNIGSTMLYIKQERFYEEKYEGEINTRSFTVGSAVNFSVTA